MDSRKSSKRLKGFGIPIEVCVRFERMIGLKTGETPTKKQSEQIARMMVTALTEYASTVILSSKDYELIAKEVAENEAR